VIGWIGAVPKLKGLSDWLYRRYLRLWNPINYMIIGGIGVLVNFLVQIPLMFVGVPWVFQNAAGILTAFIWNWSQSVGPFGYLWGFKQDANRGFP